MVVTAQMTGSRSTRIKRNLLFRAVAGAAAAGLAIVSASGCHREFYRKQADQEVACLIQEKKSHLARRPTADMSIEVDRRSRMFNPFDLDFQPMPLDDPASYRYMQCVDGRRGYPMWEAAGFTNTSENPDWWQFLPLNEDGVLVLNAETAVQLALLHSPEYQRQLEQLYLSALDVSSERFRFDTQFFGGAFSQAAVAGRNAPGGESSLISTGTSLSMQRSFTTGSQLIAELANSIVWQVSGNNTQVGVPLLNLTFIQPLLRGAGRDVVMERLTLSERRLLANVRAFERYRRSFYLNITIGRNTESQVNRSGGVFGVGLQGFTGLGGGFAGLGGGGGGGGAGFTTGAAVPQAGGFLGLLQEQLQIKILEENIARLSESLLILENTLIELLTTIPDDPEAIIRQRLQVAQQRNALIDQRSSLVSRKAAFQASIDSYLQDLGLPPYLCTKIEDPLLDRFELIDEDLRSRREELIQLRSTVGALNIELLDNSEMVTDDQTGLPTASLKWSDDVRQTLSQLNDNLEPLRNFLDQLQNEDAPRVKADLQTFAESIPERLTANERLLRMYQRERETICSLLNVDKIDNSIFQADALPELNASLEDRYDKLMDRLSGYGGKIESIEEALQGYLKNGQPDETPIELAENVREKLILATQDLLTELGDDVLTLQLIQARARTESALLPEIDITPSEAFEIARKNRRDWANARASLVDSWRLIEFNADALESGLRVAFDGTVRGDGDNPFSFRGDTSTLVARLEWDAPITRLQERNTYRQSLIEFERARRSYYQFEDQIWRLVRGQIRQLQVNRLTFEYGRQSVRIAASQIELNEDIRELRDARGLSSGPTAARDTISALADLRRAQESLLNIYVNYEVVRRNLQFDLGIMEITPEGYWIDQEVLDPQYLLSLPGTEAVYGRNCSPCGIRIKTPPRPLQSVDWLQSDPMMLELEPVEPPPAGPAEPAEMTPVEIEQVSFEK
jgi:hypothetical protein